MNEVDGDKLNGLVGKMLGDLGGAFSVLAAVLRLVAAGKYAVRGIRQ
jgi:hypothetical protein